MSDLFKRIEQIVQGFFYELVKELHTIGAGPKPILVKNLSVEKLTRGTAEAESDVLRERAQAIGKVIRSEDGIGRAVNLIGKISNNFHNVYL